MTQQRAFPPPIADGNLTARQQIVYDYLQANPRGVYAIDAGRHLHVTKDNPCRYCKDGDTETFTCQFAARDARAVLDSLRGSPHDPEARRLVVRKQTGLWRLRGPVRASDPGELPEGF